jgi:hypothetical protein
MPRIPRPSEDHTAPPEDEGGIKKISLNIDLADYQRMKTLLPEAKRLGAVPRSTTQTDLICEGLKLRLDEVEKAIQKRRAKK